MLLPEKLAGRPVPVTNVIAPPKNPAGSLAKQMEIVAALRAGKRFPRDCGAGLIQVAERFGVAIVATVFLNQRLETSYEPRKAE